MATSRKKAEAAPREAWAVFLGGHVVEVRDLLVSEIEQVTREVSELRMAAGLSEITWHLVVDMPLLDLKIADRVVRIVAGKLNIDLPGELTPRMLVDWFDKVPDTVPDDTSDRGKPETVPTGGGEI